MGFVNKKNPIKAMDKTNAAMDKTNASLPPLIQNKKINI